MRPTVLLFDIDGTLVSTGGAGRRAIDRAFVLATGREAVIDFSFAGMTDPAIVRRTLVNMDLPADLAAIEAVLEAYLTVLEEEVYSAPRFVIHEGIPEALAAAEGWSRVAVGLGTGNIERGARVKLSRGDLHHRFAFGGFGSDSEDRAELLRKGAERGAARLGATIEECRVVIIGDTPKDVAAAIAIGAESIGVGTGPFTPAELRECGATWAFSSLLEDGAMSALRGDR
ncbi:MAG: HAD hydrolase-like protein [Polyangiaceae bacterium]